MSTYDLVALKKEAKDLGISYANNVTGVVLHKKIEDYYATKENTVKAETTSVKVTGKDAFIQDIKKKASKTSIVTIIDNDQRVNNQKTTCVVNCSNEYFDLGTVVLPLNQPIEVAAGHLNVIKAVRIPQHVKDNASGLSTVRLVPRYTIQEENVKK